MQVKDLKHRIRLLAIDLDDTLLRDNNTVSDYTRNVLRQAQAAGYEIVIATGRMFQTAEPVGRAIGLGDLPMVLYSGGLIQRIESREILYENAIPVDVAREVLRLVKENGWYAQSYIDDELLIDTPNDKSRAYEKGIGAKAVVLGDKLYTPHHKPNKLLIVEDPDTLEKVIPTIKEALGDKIELLRSKVNFLEVVAPHVSKGDALEGLGKTKHIDLSEMVAFGNSENDISMLKMAGHSVAVANAEEPIKALADEICLSNEEDGVAHWIEDNLL